MRRIKTVLVLVLALLLVPTAAMASDEVQVTDRVNETDVSDERPTDVREHDRTFERAKARALHQVEGLLRVLEGLKGKIGSSRFITEAHAGMLRGDIARAEAGLETLARKIADAENWEELRPLIGQIDDFAVLTVLAPKTFQVIASDTLVAIAGKFDRFAGKLGELIERLEEAGHDMTEAWRLLGEMKDAIAAGERLAGPVAGMVIGLGPADWPDPAQGILAEGRSSLHEARGSLRSAYGYGKQIVELIRSLIDTALTD
jgi:hypothetical protein